MTPPAALGDVARLAGVSKATASKVFNGRADVASTTRERVAQAARELGYAPTARPATSDVTQVWVVFNSLANPYAATVLEGLLAEARVHDVIVPLSSWGSGVDRRPRPSTPEWIEQAQHRGADAILLVTTPLGQAQVDACAKRGTPLVVIDPANPVPDGVMTVGATNWRGGVLATEHLLALGHRRLAFVGAPASSTPGAERLAGLRSAFEAGGVDPATAAVREGTFEYADGLACRDLLRRPERPTAIFAACDSVALGVLEAARQVGLRVPEDLSVVGFDDSYAALGASPQLTTVRQPLREMGRLALRAAVSALRGHGGLALPVQLATTLVERGTTAPARARP